MEKLLNLDSKSNKTDESAKYVKKADQIWSMLDDMAQTDPNGYKNFIEKALKDGKEALKPPEPNMCVKASIFDLNDEVLYINFFSWNTVPAPETDEHPIPIYGKKIYKDKANVNIINLAFNPTILDKYGKSAKNSEERTMLINLAFKFIENQNKIKLETDEFDVLKSKIFYGDIDVCLKDLRGKDSDKNENMSKLDMAKEAMEFLKESGNESSFLSDDILSKIANIDLSKKEPSNKSAKPLIEEVESQQAEVPNYEKRILKSKTNEKDFVCDFKIYLPKINSIDECNLNVDNYYVTLNMNNNDQYKQLKIPLSDLESNYLIQSDKVEAKFVKKEKYLNVKIHLKLKN